jgi:hypothetical protein
MIAQNIPFKNILNTVIGWKKVICEVMAVMKNTVVCVMTICSLVEFYGYFRGSEECTASVFRVKEWTNQAPSFPAWCMVGILFNSEGGGSTFL